MIRYFASLVIYALVASIWMPSPAAADELSDAIRQAEEAKAESQRLSRSAEEGRSKARQLYEETKFVKFQLAAENYVSASSRFDRAADAFHRAGYYLERARSTGNPSLLDDAQSNFREAGDHYNEGIQHARRAGERFNGGIEEYNRQLRDERKRKADANRTDAFNLMKSIEGMTKKIEGKSRSSEAVSCLKGAHSRAQWAFGEFHSAVNNAEQAETYKEKTQKGIQYYNQAVQMVKQAREKGKCTS
jgi:hypothetical protein